MDVSRYVVLVVDGADDTAPEEFKSSLTDLLTKSDLWSEAKPDALISSYWIVLWADWQQNKCVTTNPDSLWTEVAQNLPVNILVDQLCPENESACERNVPIPDTLHRLVDSVPAAGSVLDVVLHFSKENEISANIKSLQTYVSFSFHPTTSLIPDSMVLLLYGAMKRLVEWHCAKVTFVSSPDGDNLCCLARMLKADRVDDLQQLSLQPCVLWRGKVKLFDRLNNNGILLSGFIFQRRQHHLPVRVSLMLHQDDRQVTRSENGSEPVYSKLGAVLEVIDIVDVSTIPLFYIQAKSFRLSLLQGFSQSRIFLDHVMASDKSGLIARIPQYHKMTPTYKEQNLSTTAWKDCVMADVPSRIFHPDPESQPAVDLEYQHFLLLRDQQSSDVVAYMLRPPEQLTGVILDELQQQNNLMQANVSISVEPVLEHLPKMNSHELHEIHTTLAEFQLDALEEWLSKREQAAEPPSLITAEFFSFLAEVQHDFLKTIKKILPLHKSLNPEHFSFLPPAAETQKNSADWPERLFLKHQESKKKAICRFQSSDSLSLSSPPAPLNYLASKEMDEVLNQFMANGCPVATNLSPLQSQHNLHPHIHPVLEEAAENTQLPWPDCKDVQFPDVYYNRGSHCEKIQERLNKIRDKLVPQETRTTCSSPLFQLLSWTKDGEDIKKCSKLTKSEKDCGAKRQKCSQKSLKDNSKRHKNETVKPLHRSSSDGLSMSKKRKLTTSAQQGVQKKPCLAKSLSYPLAAACSKEQQDKRAEIYRKRTEGKCMESRKETRSQRHKRKLDDIVKEILLEWGVKESSDLYSSCAQRLFKVTKLYVMDLPNSRNLAHEMKKIAKGQVQQVIELETHRQKLMGRSQSKQQTEAVILEEL